MARFTALLLALPLAVGATAVEADVLRVPGDADTVQAAVDKAGTGDTIEVGAGRWCGAAIKTQLTLVGRDGAVISGAQDGVTCGPELATAVGTFRIGFELRTGASGTSISHFTFDGADVLNDSSAVALAVYAPKGTKVTDVRIEHNTVLGGIQGFTNWGGDRWVVRHNKIRGLTAKNGNGGFGIVVSAPTDSLRPQQNSITHNEVEGVVPSFLSGTNWFPGVRVADADDTEVAFNRFELKRPAAEDSAEDSAAVAAAPNSNRGVGVLVTHQTGLGSRGTRVTSNNGKKADYVVVVDGNGSNVVDMRANLGVTLVEGQESTATDRKDVAATRGPKNDDPGRRHRGRDRGDEDRLK